MNQLHPHRETRGAGREVCAPTVRARLIRSLVKSQQSREKGVCIPRYRAGLIVAPRCPSDPGFCGATGRARESTKPQRQLARCQMLQKNSKLRSQGAVEKRHLKKLQHDTPGGQQGKEWSSTSSWSQSLTGLALPATPEGGLFRWVKAQDLPLQCADAEVRPGDACRLEGCEPNKAMSTGWVNF